MKKVILLSVAGLFSFVASTVGIYLAMPSIAPALVAETRTHLDSLGLAPIDLADSLVRTESGPADDEVVIEFGKLASGSHTMPRATDSTSSAQSDDSIPLPAADRSHTELYDSLNSMVNRVIALEQDNAALTITIDDLEKQIISLRERDADVAELSKSLNKLEDRQLAGILFGLDFEIFEMLYLQASAREKSRLLQHLPPDRAARYVRMLMGSEPNARDSLDQLSAADQDQNDAPIE